MLTPARLSQLIVEFIFFLLGALVVWLAANGKIYFDRHGVGWLVISVAIAAWGLLALARQGQWWAKWQRWNRGGSLLLLGLLMLAITRVPFPWVAPFLAAAGVILALRGLLGALLILRQR